MCVNRAACRRSPRPEAPLFETSFADARVSSAEPTLPFYSLDRYLADRKRRGARLVEASGVVWQESPRGLFTPAHLLQRLPEDLHLPRKLLAWGWRHRVGEDAQTRYYMPVHLLDAPASYSEASLPSNDRRKLGKARRSVEVAAVTDAGELEQGGYEVYSEAFRRGARGAIPTKDEYRRLLADFVDPDTRVILAARIDGVLAGYISAFAVEGTAYGDEVCVSELGRKHEANRLLVFEMTRLVGRTPGVREFYVGQHWLERPGVTDFKTHMGFPVVRVPVRIKVNRVVLEAARRLRPDKAYRLFGAVDLRAPYGEPRYSGARS